MYNSAELPPKALYLIVALNTAAQHTLAAQSCRGCACVIGRDGERTGSKAVSAACVTDGKPPYERSPDQPPDVAVKCHHGRQSGEDDSSNCLQLNPVIGDCVTCAVVEEF